MSAYMLYYSIYYIGKTQEINKKERLPPVKVQHFIIPAACLEIPFINGIDRDPDPSTIRTRTASSKSAQSREFVYNSYD
jgi:hypothetical protein